MSKKKNYKKLEKKIGFENKSAWLTVEKDVVMKFSKGYKDFLAKNKTEREVAGWIVDKLKDNGFKNIDKIKGLKTGDKVYKLFKNKLVLAGIIGKNKENLRLLGAHIDSPRLDLKPSPVFEKSSLALFKSHYYGGIKKYQWVNVPLSFHAIIHTKKGKQEIVVGEKRDEPKFIIPDLLAHLSGKQMKKKMNEAIEGEQLNIVINNIPIDDEKIKKKVKLNVLKLLNDKYNIVERNFLSAEIEFTPALRPVDIGFDNSMICAYGQDDRAGVYAALKALTDIEKCKHTSIAFFIDKEEIGSYGNTGAQSKVIENFISEIIGLSDMDKKVNEILENAKSISADVSNTMNPNFTDVNDKQNVSYLGHGVSVEKYTGAKGKYSTNDTSSEYMSWLVSLLEKNGIEWQTGELGKVDIGQGGTISVFMSKLGMDSIDVGPCILSMHSPAEISSKVDIYNAYRAYKVFFES